VSGPLGTQIKVLRTDSPITTPENGYGHVEEKELEVLQVF